MSNSWTRLPEAQVSAYFDATARCRRSEVWVFIAGSEYRVMKIKVLTTLAAYGTLVDHFRER